MNTIIDQLPVWVTAIAPKSRGKKNGIDNISPYGIQRLRELILELAVRGKLVPQDPSDEPASVLLEKIAKEKNRLVAEGKIKKQKKLPKITAEEKPFELPKGWEWVRLGNISNFTNGYAFKSTDFIDDDGIGIVKIGDIQDGIISTASMTRIKPDITKTLDESLQVKRNNLVIAMSGATTGKLGFNRSDEIFYLNQRVGKIEPYYIPEEYLNLPLSIKITENLEKSMGSAIPNLSTAQIKEIVLALPPITEQQRIVAKVDELMTLCDQLEAQQMNQLETHQKLTTALLATLTAAKNAEELSAAWQQLEPHFEELFTSEESIEQLKQTILQLAVMGKLVPQDPSDEPASVLLKKIAIEKKRLIAEGKIKKQKPLPKITDEEKPFELPKGWEWVRIGDISLLIEYGMSEKTYNEIEGIPVLKMGDIQDGKIILGGQKCVPKNVEGLPSLFLKKWDLLYNRTNSAELVGKTGIYEGENDRYTFASYLIRIRCSEKNVYPKFLNLSMNEPSFRKTQIEPHLKQQCGQANVNGTILKSMIIPLPPIDEQHRIVSKVEELYTLCDSLKERIQEAQKVKVKLADTAVYF